MALGCLGASNVIKASISIAIVAMVKQPAPHLMQHNSSSSLVRNISYLAATIDDIPFKAFQLG
jgi:hypothetical protein